MDFTEKNKKSFDIELKLTITVNDLSNIKSENNEFDSTSVIKKDIHKKRIVMKEDIRRNIEKYRNNACAAFKNKRKSITNASVNINKTI
jgi:hypothetical protein